MLNSKHLSDVDEKGYTIIKGFFNEEKLNSWKSFWAKREALALKHALKDSQNIKQQKSPIQIDIGGNKQKYIERIQHVLIETTKGKEFIEETIKLIQQINPKAEYLKDRYITQKAKSLSGYGISLPHQDTTTYCLEELGSQAYTVYIALTDTDENTGTLFIEDMEEKRTESLGMCELGCASGFACICLPGAIYSEQYKNYTGQNKIKSQHKLIPTSLEAGDCIIFDGFLLHGTAINMGEHDRKTMTLTYVTPHDSSEDLIKQHYKYRSGVLSLKESA